MIELWYWDCLQVVNYSCFNVFWCLKITFFKVETEKKKSHRPKLEVEVWTATYSLLELLFLQNFWTNFPHPQFIAQKLMNDGLIENWLFTKHSDIQKAQDCSFWQYFSQFLQLQTCYVVLLQSVLFLWKCHNSSENPSPRQNIVSIGLLKLYIIFYHTFIEYEGKPDGTVLEIDVSHFQNTLKKNLLKILGMTLWLYTVQTHKGSAPHLHLPFSPNGKPTVLPRENFCIYFCKSKSDNTWGNIHQEMYQERFKPGPMTFFCLLWYWVCIFT